MLEYWPPARRSYGSERILEKWVLSYSDMGIMVMLGLKIKLKMDSILKNPIFHHSTIPLFHD